MKPHPPLKSLGRAEQVAMDCVWNHGPITAEACRARLAGTWPMKESTMRTVLRRLEEKGFVRHQTDGRTYVYRAAEPRGNFAVRAVKNIIDRFCNGSAEQLVLGMVDNAVLTPRQLARLHQAVADAGRRRKPR